MRIISLCLLFVFTFSLSYSQSAKKMCVVKLIFKVPYPIKNLSVKIENAGFGITNSNPLEILNLELKGTVTHKTLFLNEPCLANILILSDSMQISGSGIVLSKEKIEISIDSVALEIDSKQNTFYKENAMLYLRPPDLLVRTKGYSRDIVRKNYKLKIPDNIRLFKMYEEYERNVLSDVKANAKYYYGLVCLSHIKSELSLYTLQKCFDYLPIGLKQSTYGKIIIAHIEDSKNLSLGSIMPDFELADTTGKNINSDELKSRKKYLLLDFWASWCAPCREKMKYLKSIYAEIDTSKIDIVSISIDENVEKWKKATIEEKVPWENYYDFLSIKRTVSTIFAIDEIPVNFLYDRNNLLVQKNIGDNSFYEFLKKEGMLKSTK